jgi:hypothetical protein
MKIAILAMLVSLSASADESKEMYMPNEAGGVVALTAETCGYTKAVEQGYEYHAYATEEIGEKVVHEGCWTSPSTAGASQVEGLVVVPVVNTWWAEGGRATFSATQFVPEHPVEIKPTL